MAVSFSPQTTTFSCTVSVIWKEITLTTTTRQENARHALSMMAVSYVRHNLLLGIAVGILFATYKWWAL